MRHQSNVSCSLSLRKLYPNPQYYDTLFRFKKDQLPILERYKLSDSLILDEGDHFLLRAEMHDRTAAGFKKELDSLVNKSPHLAS